MWSDLPVTLDWKFGTVTTSVDFYLHSTASKVQIWRQLRVSGLPRHLVDIWKVDTDEHSVCQHKSSLSKQLVKIEL